MRTLTALPLLLLLCACDEEFKPSSVVEGLRVLAMRATPAELAPGQSATLSALVVDPSRPGRRHTLLWLGCEPDPLNLGRSACSDTEALADPTRFVPVPQPDGTSALPPGVSLLGFDAQATYSVREDLFTQLPPEDPRRRSGTVGQVLLLAIAEELAPGASREELAELYARVRRREVASALTLFRLRVSEDSQVNANPVLGALRAGGEPLAPGATLRLAADAPTPLELEVPDESFETYTQPLPDGTLETRTERLISAWYATSGLFEPSRVVLRSDTPLAYLPPDGSPPQPSPEDRRGTLWVVVRDVRGGQSWREAPFYLCDAGLPAPRVTELVTAEGRLVLRGESLSSVLDVLVGGLALAQAAFVPAQGTFQGLLPALPPGEHAVVVRGKHCQDETLPQRHSQP